MNIKKLLICAIWSARVKLYFRFETDDVWSVEGVQAQLGPHFEKLEPVTDGFVRYGIPLKCLRDKGVEMSALNTPFILVTRGQTDFSLGEVRLGTDAEVVLPCN